MSFWDVTGGVERTLVNFVPSGIDNDQGTIRAGGNIGSTDKFSADAVSLGTSRYITVVSGLNGVSGALAAGTFNSGDQVIRRVTNDIAGVSNTTLLSGSSNASNRPKTGQKAAVSTYYYKTAVRTGGWHEFSGVWSTAVSVGATGIHSQETDLDASSVLISSGVDHAANPTAAIPGELTYRQGGPLPTNDDYQARTLF